MQSQKPLIKWRAIYHDGTVINEDDVPNSEHIDRKLLKEFGIIKDGNPIFVAMFPEDGSRKLIFKRQGMAQAINFIAVVRNMTEKKFLQTGFNVQYSETVDPDKTQELNQAAMSDPERFHIRYACGKCNILRPLGGERLCKHECGEIPIIFDTVEEVAYVQQMRATTSKDNPFVYIVGWHQNVKGVSIKSICYVYENGLVEFDGARNNLQLAPCEKW